MPVKEGKVAMFCELDNEFSKTHTCCDVLSEKTENDSEKKDCCSGTSKMSCCVNIISITLNEKTLTFTPVVFKKKFYRYIENQSSFEFDIFHPPILI